MNACFACARHTCAAYRKTSRSRQRKPAPTWKRTVIFTENVLPTTEPDGINWIKIGDTDKGGKYIYKTKEKIRPEGVAKSRMVHSGDFLLTNSMSFGRPYILKSDGCIHDGWLVLSNRFECYSVDFLYYILSSPFAYYQFCDSVSGAVVKNLNSDKVANALFPLPPLSEQKRIVQRIEELLPLVKGL